MRGKSTHGLRPDQLVALFRIAATGADQADTETSAERKAKPSQERPPQRVPDEPREPSTNGGKTQRKETA
jgi:hypothetical protein